MSLFINLQLASLICGISQFEISRLVAWDEEWSCQHLSIRQDITTIFDHHLVQHLKLVVQSPPLLKPQIRNVIKLQRLSKPEFSKKRRLQIKSNKNQRRGAFSNKQNFLLHSQVMQGSFKRIKTKVPGAWLRDS